MNFARFVRTIIRSQFGEVVEKVADSLLGNGVQALSEIIASTKLEAIVVKKALIALVAHDIVLAVQNDPQGATEGKAAPKKKPKIVYELDTDMVCYRTRFAQYAMHIKELFGRECEVVVETFCQHGKLSTRQLLDVCVTRLATERKIQQNASQMGMVRSKVEGAFRQLISQNYVIRADTLATSQTRSLERKRKINEQVQDNVASARQKKKGSSRVVNLGLEEEKEEAEAGGSGEGDDDQTFYTLSHRRFLFDFRNQEIVHYVERRLDSVAGSLIRCLLERYPMESKTAVAELDEQQMLDVLAEQPNAPQLDMESLESYLGELEQDNVSIVQARMHGWVINTVGILDELRIDNIQSVCREKYGNIAARIFKLLTCHKKLEEKQVAELATAPRKQAREMLHQMLKGQFVELQEVPKFADRAPARTFFLWGVNVKAVHDILLDQFYAAYSNVRLRLDLESETIKPLIAKLQVSENISEEEKAQFDKWKRGSERMENTLIKIDQCIMLFRDF